MLRMVMPSLCHAAVPRSSLGHGPSWCDGLVERLTIDLSCGPVSYLQWGSPAAAEAVVLLHGGGYDSASLSWALLGPALADAGYRVLAPDHPGYGSSPMPEWPSTVRNLSNYVDEFIEAVGVGERYFLAGISLGGSLALARALDHPEGLRGLVLFAPYGIMSRMGTGPAAGLVHLLSWLSVKSRALDGLAPIYARSRRAVQASMGYIVSPQARTDALLDELVAAAANPEAGKAFSQWQRDEISLRGLRTDFTNRLGSLIVPTLIVQGTKDVGVPLVDAQRAAKLIPDAQLLAVEGAAHWVQRDRPDIVTPAVIEFLRSA